MKLLVIDVGSSSMRGGVYDQHGAQYGTKQLSYAPRYGGGGRVEQPAADFEEALVEILRALAPAAEGRADGIALTAQRSSIAPVDAEGSALADFIMWQDTRCADVCGRLAPFEEEILQRSGAKVNTVFSGGKMAWILENRRDILPKTHKLVNIPEYLIHRMTGNFVTDVTYGARSHLMDQRTRSWDPALLKLFGVDERYLCRLLPVGSVCGGLTETFARRCGLPAGTPVISAGGDQQCASLGQGAYKPGVVSIVAGTGAYLTAVSDRVPDHIPESVIVNCASVPGKYLLEANTPTCCSAFDWYCRNFYEGPDGVKRADAELEEVYNTEVDIFALPYFQGRSTPVWDPSATGAFLGLTLESSRKTILKALLEGIFLEVAQNIENLKKFTPIASANISGGLTNSRIINRIQADIYGMPLYRLPNAESTSVGALMAALVTLGAYPDTETAYKAIRGESPGERIDPDMKKHQGYLAKQERLERYYQKLFSEG